MRWSAVFAGTALAIGLWILFQTLGMGIGLSAVDVDDAGNLKGIGIGTGIWSLIAPLIALFTGAWLVGRLCGSRDRKLGAMHGSVMWALATAIGLWAMLSVVSAVASGAARVGGAAMSAGGQVVSGAASAAGGVQPKQAMEALGLDANDLVAPINERLEREGKPPVTSQQVETALKAIAQRGVREGRLDREVIVQELARNTALTPADAQEVASDVEKRYEEARTKVGDKVEQVGETAKTAALTAADRTGKALLFGGLMLLLSLGASLLGGALGVPKLHGRDVPPREREDLRTEPPSTLGTPGSTVTTTTRRDVEP